MMLGAHSDPGDRRCDAAAATPAGPRRHHPRFIGAVLAVFLLVAGSAAPAAAAEVIKADRATVIDGDTIDVGSVRVRIHGIDAPELGQRCANGRGGAWPCGEHAVSRLAELVAAGPLSCRRVDVDQYGRVVAVCHVRGVDVGAQLVEEGLAWASRRYSDAYDRQEDAARRARRGVWRAETEPPWAFRDQRWRGAADTAPRRGCPIKGNITSKGEKVYHVPWSPWYDRTGIDEARGERWFCDEAEAAAAGWRPARWR